MRFLTATAASSGGDGQNVEYPPGLFATSPDPVVIS